MRRVFRIGFLLFVAAAARAALAAPAPESVAVVFNSAISESGKLAAAYCKARGIPEANLIPLDLPDARDISRADYEEDLAKPLRAHFDRKGWWKRQRDGSGMLMPVENRIRVLVLMRGVPMRIQPEPKPAAPAPAAGAQPDPFKGHDEAAVDSELALFGIEGPSMTLEGVLQNKYYKLDMPIGLAGLPFQVLTARIDAASYDTCARMIRDAVEAEKTGLWGMAYVDIANKHPQGDEWLQRVAAANFKAGIPTVVDRFNETLPTHYPMTEAALYHGWYDWNINGPFLHPGFRFRKGAVALHIHSFSAEQLGDVRKNWSAGLLERGAAVTVGNVYEPYLQCTHDFAILHERLLAGHSWVEACWMSLPCASWQAITLGDPLYVPFKHLSGTGDLRKEDNAYRALRTAVRNWNDDPAERFAQLEKAADRTRSGVFLEAVALELLAQGRVPEAAVRFRRAKALYTSSGDRMRQDLHLIGIDRAAGRKELALQALREAQARYGALPEAAALRGWVDLLDPPPPAPAKKP